MSQQSRTRCSLNDWRIVGIAKDVTGTLREFFGGQPRVVPCKGIGMREQDDISARIGACEAGA